MQWVYSVNSLNNTQQLCLLFYATYCWNACYININKQVFIRFIVSSLQIPSSLLVQADVILCLK